MLQFLDAMRCYNEIDCSFCCAVDGGNRCLSHRQSMEIGAGLMNGDFRSGAHNDSDASLRSDISLTDAYLKKSRIISNQLITLD